MAAATIRIGANCWNQHTGWPALLEAGRLVDRLGYDTLWTWDQAICATTEGGHKT
jgi:hypothetical protein